MWKNSLKNVESDNNKSLYETLVDFFYSETVLTFWTSLIPLLCVQWKIADDGQRNCPKHVEFYSKNKFEKLVYLIGFIIRIWTEGLKNI